MPRHKPNPDTVTVKLGPAMYSMDGGETWEEGGPLDYLRRRAGLATSPPHACEGHPMCDSCRDEFEAWKTAKGKP
jgi:hypothetical protein